jgi:diadenosine tetraphosphatase ApaH/serine/threonine PP2A family protein phosphatase
VGHTHVPGVFLPTPDFYSPDELDGEFEFDDAHKALINVGSVGQPRDRDPRASYVVVERGVVRFIRVEYDVDTVSDMVHEVPELDDFLGARLKDGR